MAFTLVTSFVNGFHAEVREHISKYFINWKNASLSEIHALAKYHEYVQANIKHNLKVFTHGYPTETN